MISVLLFVSTYFGGIFLALTRHPVWIVIVYQLVYFFNPQLRWWGNMVPDLRYSFFIVAIMGGLFIWRRDMLTDNVIPPPLKWLYALITMYYITYFYAAMPEFHLEYAITYIKLGITLTLMYKLCTEPRHLDMILYGYIAGAAYIGYVAFQVGRNATGGRVDGIGTVDAPDPNFISAAIAPAIVICLYYFWIKSNWKIRVAIAVAGAFIANGIVLINSRGAFLAVAASVGLFMMNMYFSSFQRQYQKAAAVMLTVLGLSAALIVVDASFIDRIKTITQTEVDAGQETGATRTVFWKAAVDMSFDYPLGQGALGFNYHAPFYIPQNIDTGASRARSVHSTWFETLTEAGYPGLFMFIMMLASTFKLIRLTKKRLVETQQVDEYFKLIAIRCALIGFIMAMTFINRMRAEILYWCILFACVAYNVYVMQPQKNNTQIPSRPPGTRALP